MRIFIAWSGSSSKKVAAVLRDWLPTVVPAAEPWISSEDIEKGTRWSSELAKQLEQTSYGILCVTPGNQNSPWLNFEAGALSKSLDEARVSPFLLGVEFSELPSTLSQFQATLYEKEDLLRLARTINKACAPDDIEELRLQSAFDVCWPGLVLSLDEILRELQAETDEAIASLAASDMSLEESQSKLRREKRANIEKTIHYLELLKGEVNSRIAALPELIHTFENETEIEQKVELAVATPFWDALELSGELPRLLNPELLASLTEFYERLGFVKRVMGRFFPRTSSNIFGWSSFQKSSLLGLREALRLGKGLPERIESEIQKLKSELEAS